MKKGILVIAALWTIINGASYVLFGIGGAVVSTYVCGAIVWIFRKKFIKLLNI